jgi:LuxR family maltose regulon positive regulatory protein
MALLRAKLYTPPPQPELVPRPRLIERLNTGLRRKLTLISTPAGFGRQVVLFSLDQDSSDAALGLSTLTVSRAHTILVLKGGQ